MKPFIFLCLCFILGCAGTGKLTTESGKPEVLVLHKSRPEISKLLQNWAPTKGQIVIGSEGSVVNTSSSVDVPIGIAMTQNVGAKTVYNIISKGDDCKVYSLRFIAASKDPYGYYKPMDASSVLTNEFNTQAAYEQLQAELDDFVQFAKNN
jgi:hypothetical protein